MKKMLTAAPFPTATNIPRIEAEYEKRIGEAFPRTRNRGRPRRVSAADALCGDFARHWRAEGQTDAEIVWRLDHSYPLQGHRWGKDDLKRCSTAIRRLESAEGFPQDSNDDTPQPGELGSRLRAQHAWRKWRKLEERAERLVEQASARARRAGLAGDEAAHFVSDDLEREPRWRELGAQRAQAQAAAEGAKASVMLPASAVTERDRDAARCDSEELLQFWLSRPKPTQNKKDLAASAVTTRRITPEEARSGAVKLGPPARRSAFGEGPPRETG